MLGLYAIFASLLLAAVWGASQATPIAGAGHQAVIHGWTKRSFTSVENPCTFV